MGLGGGVMVSLTHLCYLDCYRCPSGISMHVWILDRFCVVYIARTLNSRRVCHYMQMSVDHNDNN